MSIFDRFRKKQTKERLTAIGRSAVPAQEKKVSLKEKPKEQNEKKEPTAKKTATPTRLSESANRILLKPLITEKAVLRSNTYVFAIHPSANKQEVKRAIMDLYGVRPIAVNVQNRKGKPVRYGRHEGRTKNWRKAIVLLQEGDTIESTKGA